jgi:hypothetical protein
MLKKIFTLLLLTSCSGSYYSQKEPKFDFKKFYSSKAIAHGVYFDIFGRASSRFIIKSEPIENPNYKNDNKTLYKQSIEYIESGKKKDMISYAIFTDKYPVSFYYKDNMMLQEGEYTQDGNFAKIKYNLGVENNGKIINLSCHDNAYMVNEDNIINIIKLKKFGIPVGKIVMHITKLKSVS